MSKLRLLSFLLCASTSLAQVTAPIPADDPGFPSVYDAIAVSSGIWESKLGIQLGIQAKTRDSKVIIDELYFEPQDKTSQARFVELYNRSDVAVDLTKWSLEGSISFTFPNQASIAPRGYLVVAQNPEAFAKQFGGVAAFGPFAGTLHKRGGEIALHDAQGQYVDLLVCKVGFPWPTAAGGAGSSLELINPDLPRDNPASWRSSGYAALADPAKPRSEKSKAPPTPGAQNSAFLEKLPPLIDEVTHWPKQPSTGEALKIEARIHDPTGALKSATVEYQIVEPGAYIAKNGPNYDKGWTPVPMNDEGRDGDATAGDSVYTATLPASLSVHRRLIRYRIVAEGASGNQVRVPYPDDDCPNFAAFVYDGLPAWKAAVRPGKTPSLTFPSTLMKTLPSVILIANADDVERSQWDGGDNKAKTRGTIIANGVVYDNIQFHNRGQASTYVSGKNKWGFKFDRGRDFDARDEWGRKFSHGWDNMPMNACASPWAQANRGMAGLDEAVSFRLYELAGTPSPRPRHVQFRVIDQAEEAPADQYSGDMWGLYLVVEDPDGGFLSTRDLPEGNVYRIAGGGGDRKHQSPTQPSDGSDWNAFRDASQRDQKEDWWRANLDLQAFFGFQAINRLVGNVDLREDDNHYFYHRPDGRWTVIPWDLDMMFIPKSHQSGRIRQERCLEQPAIKIEYQNRCRELLDLLCSDASPNGGQVGQIVDEFASIVHPAGFPLAWPELDECMWDYHPRTSEKGAFYRNPMPGGADHNWTRTLATPDFFGFTKFITDYCTDTRPGSKWHHDDGDPRGYGFGYLRDEGTDPAAPQRPTISYGGAEGFPAKALRFKCSDFASPRKAAFAALQWRLGEISAPGVPSYEAGQPRVYEIEGAWTSPEIAQFAPEIQVPAEAAHPGHTYRARVRMKDATGRWSHWSEPVKFVVQAAQS